MVKRYGITISCCFLLIMGIVASCNSPTKATDPLIGTWVGSAGRLGGGGNNLDSFGIVLEVKASSFTLYRGNKVWGSSLFIRDSSKDAGTWSKNASGDTVTFTPDTANDLCNKWTESTGWQLCKGYNTPDTYCECYPEFKLKIAINGNTWSTPIENSKLSGKYDLMNLVKK